MEKYYYKDWLEGKLDSEENIVFLYFSGELRLEEYEKIEKGKEEAFLKRLKDTYEIKKERFIDRYNKSLVKEDLINQFLTNVETSLQKIKTEHPEFVTNVIKGQDGRNELTSTQVAAYLSFDPIKDKDNSTEINNVLNYQGLKDTPFEYIVKVNLYKWLRWFKKRESEANTAPEINLSSSYVEEEIAKAKAEKESNSIEPISYKWRGKPVEIENLYKKLIPTYIPADTDIENFKALFSGKPLVTIKPIKWLKQKNLLAYFIDELYRMGKLPADTYFWSIAEACFVNTKNLKQIKANYLNNKKQSKPTGFEEIDIILKEVK